MQKVFQCHETLAKGGERALGRTNSTSPSSVRNTGVFFRNGALPLVSGDNPKVLAMVLVDGNSIQSLLSITQS